MDQASNEKDSKDSKPLSTKSADTPNTKPEGSSNGAKSKNDKKPGSQKSNPSSSLATKSKIPERKTKPTTTTTTTTKTKTDSPMSTSMSGATQKTVSRMSLAKASSVKPNKSEASFSRTSLASKALSPSSAKAAQSPPVTGQTRPGIQKRADSNMSRRSTSSAAAAPKPDSESGKLRKITSMAGDQNKLETWEKKVTDIQTEFLKVLDTIKAEKKADEKMEKEYKLISFIKNDTCNFMIKEDQLKKVPQKLPAESIGDLKEKIKTNLTQHFEKIMNDLTNNPDERATAIQEIKAESTKDMCELMDNFCSSTKEETSVDTQQLENLQKELRETKEALKLSEVKLGDLTKEHEEKIAKLESQAKNKASDESNKKEGQIKDLQKKLKSLEKQHDETKKDLVEKATALEEELKASKESVTAIQKKLNSSEQLLSTERKEIKSKNETIKKLEGEVANLNKIMDEMKNKSKTDNKTPEYLRQITELRNNVIALENEKQALETKIGDMNAASSVGNNELRSKLIDSEKEKSEEKIIEYENHSKAKQECSKDVQLELAKLRQSESEKRREIDKLKVELSKSLFNIEQLKGQIQRDQQLLEVRSELINSLQTNEKNQRIQMEELFAQVGEKNTAVNELNNELRTKSDGYRELCSAINAKQLELSNQAHMIKLLEESNERSQMLRVKQEEKISRMEEDIAHLKQTIALYQNNILSNSPKLAYPPLMARPQDDYNENFYYYTSERRRKRQVDINVRKYEA